MNLKVSTPPPIFGRLFYALALLVFGVQHFMFGTFIAGRAIPWSENPEGERIIAYLSGVILIAGGISIIVKRWVSEVLAAVAIMILLWAGLRNAFQVIATFDTGGNLTSMGKALTLGSGALLVAQSLTPNKYQFLKLAVLCRYFTGLFLLASGIQHFLYADFVKFIVPAWITGAEFWTYFSAAALMAAGLGLITGIQARLAALLSGWMIFIWFLILHIPRGIEQNSQNEWTAVFEALAVSGILFLLASRLQKQVS